MTSIQEVLSNIFNVKDWSLKQYDTYKLLKHYITAFKEDNRAYELRDDKIIIRNNFKDQTWFIHSRSKPIINQMLDTMDLDRYSFDHNEHIINLYIVLKFNQFTIHGCLYKNLVNNVINYYIFFENDKQQRAYLTYYTHAAGHTTNDSVKQVRVPEFDKIYSIINIDQDLLYQCDLLNFFSEIIMYYDESGIIGDIPMGHNINVSLNQLTAKFNNYVLQKQSDVNYRVY
jgi:hypothetical protein